MIYFIITLLLFLSMFAYFKVADHFNIIDKPNERSSHSVITIRGGGIIVPVGIILYAVLFREVSYPLLFGILAISLVSFLDDVYSLPNRLRILVHLIAVTALMFEVNAFEGWPLWLIPLMYIFIIGTINAYNFMDGINGITGLYSLITLASLWHVNRIWAFANEDFIIVGMLACGVFLFFNFRKRAKCFAGDVGSVSIGFWIIALILMLVITTGDLRYILFLSVYGVDAIFTIIHRLILRQNIFEAHRLHFYQILVNENKMSHLTVSTIYAVTQLLINMIIIYSDFNLYITLLILGVPLAGIYIGLKEKLRKRAVTKVKLVENKPVFSGKKQVSKV